MTETVTVQVGKRLVFDIDVPNEQEFSEWLYATVLRKYPTRARGGRVDFPVLPPPTWLDEGYRKPPEVTCGDPEPSTSVFGGFVGEVPEMEFHRLGSTGTSEGCAYTYRERPSFKRVGKGLFDPVTGSYTIPMARSAMTGRYLVGDEAKPKGRIVVGASK